MLEMVVGNAWYDGIKLMCCQSAWIRQLVMDCVIDKGLQYIPVDAVCCRMNEIG
jgi:hypothetical protein